MVVLVPLLVLVGDVGGVGGVFSLLDSAGWVTPGDRENKALPSFPCLLKTPVNVTLL